LAAATTSIISNPGNNPALDQANGTGSTLLPRMASVSVKKDETRRRLSDSPAAARRGSRGGIGEEASVEAP